MNTNFGFVCNVKSDAAAMQCPPLQLRPIGIDLAVDNSAHTYKL